MKVSKQLLEKYNVPVPRYTSYPPANRFDTGFGENEYKNLIAASNSSKPGHIAFYVHIPFCQQICHYCGCHAMGFTKTDRVEDYIEALKKEIEMVVKQLSPERKIAQIHYGGGTPNAIESKYLKEVNSLLLNAFPAIERPEVAIECNPALLSKKYMEELFDAGFNRFSFGIQDFNEDVLWRVNRKPSAIPEKELLRFVKEANSSYTVNLDFMYGLPGQTLQSYRETIQKAIDIRPDRLVTFSYAHVPWFKRHQRILEKQGIPTPEEKMEMFLMALEMLKEAGYVDIGLDHYALPGDELSKALANNQLYRNFQGYCTRRTTGQVYAFGVSGISQLTGGYSQNVKGIKEYMTLISENKLPVERGYALSEQEHMIKETITQLMCNKQLNWQHSAQEFLVDPDELKKTVGYNPEAIEAFKADGLIRLSEGNLQLTDLGGLFVRNVAASLDPSYNAQVQNYSKSV